MHGVLALWLGGTLAVHAATVRPDREAIEEAGREAEPTPVAPPAAATSHFLQARLLREAGELQRAGDHLRLALASDPGSVAIALELARVELEAGREAAGLQRLKRLARAHPAHAEVHRQLGEALLEAAQVPAAIPTLRRAARLAPRDVPTLRSYLTGLVMGGWKGRAEKVAAAFASGPEGSVEGWRRLVELYTGLDAPKDAVRALRQVLKEAPSDLEAWQTLAELEAGLGHTVEAKEAVGQGLTAAIRQGAPTWRLRLLGAELALRRGEVESAATQLEAVLADDEVPHRLQRVAFIWLDGGEPARAASVLGQRSGDPDAPRLAYLAGLVLSRLQRFDAAAAAFDEARSGHPQAEDAALSHGVALSRAGHHDAALEALRERQRQDPRDVEVLTELARALARSGRIDAAVSLLEEALEGRHREVGHLLALAGVLQRAGRGREAIALLRQPRDWSRSDRDVLRYVLGLTLAREGHTEAALLEMRALHRALPDHAPTLNMLGYALAQAGRELEQAERLLRRALALRPGTAAYLDSLGYLLLKTGRHREAMETLEEAARREPFEPVILDHLGDALRRAGKGKEARVRWQRALELASDPDAELPRGFRDAVRRKLEGLSEAAAAR